MKRILLAGVLSWIAILTHAAEAVKSAPDNKADMMARGQQIAGAVCVACHGLDGMSAIAANPNIAGMPEQYVAKQLELFKTGVRKNPVMQGMAANLSADDMKALGRYYFAQKPKTNADKTQKKMPPIAALKTLCQMPKSKCHTAH